MNKNTFCKIVILILMLAMMISGCGRNSSTVDNDDSVLNDDFVGTTETGYEAETGGETTEMLSDEQALSAIKKYCYAVNPDLEDIEKSEEYPVYWDISSSDENEIVVLFRSYTGAQTRYYVDRITGIAYVTEFVSGITDEEQRTDEVINVREYLSED